MPRLGWEAMAGNGEPRPALPACSLSLRASASPQTVVHPLYRTTVFVQNIELCRHMETIPGSAISGPPRNTLMLPPGLAALHKGRCGQLQPRRSSVFQPRGLPRSIGRDEVGGFDGIAGVCSRARGNQEERARSPAFAFCCQRPRSLNSSEYTHPGGSASITTRSRARTWPFEALGVIAGCGS
jgi:hypothetical protein